ncbi:MAG: hypothetical protein J6C09_07770 [Clostridia bacterium]|nr:hypothetical protein [Clostridia bacterium]
MLQCRCGKRARLDDVDGTKVGKRQMWYVCDHCGYNYTFTEKSGELKEYPPE